MDIKGSNKPLAEAMLGKRMSSAAGPHKDKRDKRARTRAASKARTMTPTEFLAKLQDEAELGFHKEMKMWVDDTSSVAKALRKFEEQ